MSSDITLAGGAGEYMENATVVAWEVKRGGAVKAGQVVVVVETAKAATEIEAQSDGILTEILAPEGSEVGIGTVLGRIGERIPEAPEPASPPLPTPLAEPARPIAPAATHGERRISISPLARRLARQAGLDVSGLTGSGPGGRIKSRDIERALADRPTAAVPAPMAPAVTEFARAVTPTVLIHGFGANAAAWNALRAHLPASQPILTPELPGHGQAPAGLEASFDRLVESVLSQIEAAGMTTCHLVGHSLGGAVAAALSGHPALRVRSLTLIAPAGLGPEIDRAFLDGFLSARSPESLTPWLERLVADPKVLAAGYARAVLRERDRAPIVDAQRRLAEAVFPCGTQNLRILDDLRRFEGPLRVIGGRADRIIPHAQQGQLPGHIACHGLDGVGHMPHVEAAAMVARLLMQTAASAGS